MNNDNIIKEKKITSAEKYISILAGLGFYVKQFYISRSGSLQISDIILMTAAIMSILTYGIHIQYRDGKFAIFIFFTVIINGLYYTIYQDNRLILSILFMIYNGIAVLSIFRPMLESVIFLNSVQKACKYVLISQLLFIITGIGKWVYRGTRYVGTFNDPNQYGFYILTCFFCIYIISIIKNEKLHLFWIILPAIDIIPSASTGMISTYLIFLLGYIVNLVFFENEFKKKDAIVTFLLLISILMIAVFKEEILSILERINIFGIKRIIHRFQRSSSSGGLGAEFLEDRGLVRLIKMPSYFLYGSGEGAWFRFKSISNEGYELHSTILALPYYYGIIPFVIIVKWVYSNIRNVRMSVLFVYVALFLEALTLINHRQPIFWFLIVLASHGVLKNVQFDQINNKMKVKEE